MDYLFFFPSRLDFPEEQGNEDKVHCPACRMVLFIANVDSNQGPQGAGPVFSFRGAQKTMCAHAH